MSRASLTGFVLMVSAMPAFASGREGEGLVDVVRWIVVIVLVTFATLVVAGGLMGAFSASQSGESILKGSVRGLLKGTVAFLVVGAVSMVALTVLSALWIAYAHLGAASLKPS